MTLEATERFPASDPLKFATYTTEEFTEPTESELVEELPEYELPPAMKALAEGKPLEKPLRRGVGYLRAEVDESQESESEAHDFGAGIEDDEAGTKPDGATDEMEAATDHAPGKATDSAQSPSESESQESRPKRRRRGRRRRGRRKPEENSSETADKVSTVFAANPEDSGASGEESETSPGGGRKRKRRRRRGRRNKSGGGGDNAGESSAGDSAG